MPRIHLAIPAAVLMLSFVFSTPADAQRRRRQASTGVVVNGKQMSTRVWLALARRGARIPSGRYWYDARSGAWGLQGGPARGVLAAGLRIGGRLKSNASRGRSGVFVNGRQLTHGEALALRRLVRRLPRGHYWLDRHGNAGRVGGPALVNLRRLYRKATRPGKRGNYLIRKPGIGGRKGISVAGDGRTTCVNTAGYTRCY